jgi:hypothetical protein
MLQVTRRSLSKHQFNSNEQFLNYSSLGVLTAALLRRSVFLSREAASAGKTQIRCLFHRRLGEPNDRGLVVISVGPRASYDAGHIPARGWSRC